MLEDYKKVVIRTYRKKKESGELSLNLTHPTPRKLKDECLIVLKSGYQEKDEPFIKEFFNFGVESNDYSPAIKRFDVDKLRPLNNFLRGTTDDTEDKNIKLLAWLINFEPRPYKFGVDYDKIDIESNQESETTDTIGQGEKPEKLPEKVPLPYTPARKIKPVRRNVIASITMIAMISGGMYLYGSANEAYICEGGVAKKYHLNSSCPALKNCKNKVVQTTISEAKKNGKTLCGWE